jgi:hypothetical protein
MLFAIESSSSTYYSPFQIYHCVTTYDDEVFISHLSWVAKQSGHREYDIQNLLGIRDLASEVEFGQSSLLGLALFGHGQSTIGYPP